MNHQSPPADETLLPLPFCTVGLTILALVLSSHPWLPELLQYDALVPFRNAPWQLLTWQWVHWSASHAFWDIGTFAVLGAICERRNRHRFLTCLGLASLAGALSLLWIPPGVHACRGLSGIDSALFILATTDLILVAHATKDRRTLPLALIALLAFGLKTAFELTTGHAVFAEADAMTVLTATHAAGAIAGLLAALDSSTSRTGSGSGLLTIGKPRITPTATHHQRQVQSQDLTPGRRGHAPTTPDSSTSQSRRCPDTR